MSEREGREDEEISRISLNLSWGRRGESRDEKGKKEFWEFEREREWKYFDTISFLPHIADVDPWVKIQIMDFSWFWKGNLSWSLICDGIWRIWRNLDDDDDEDDKKNRVMSTPICPFISSSTLFQFSNDHITDNFLLIELPNFKSWWLHFVFLSRTWNLKREEISNSVIFLPSLHIKFIFRPSSLFPNISKCQTFKYCETY